MIKIFGCGDIHFSRETQEKALASLNVLRETAEREEVDLIVIAGDLFDRPVTNTESAGFPELLSVMQRMMNIAPVVAIRGTPTHDAPGCYEPFVKMNANNPFDLLTPNITYWLEPLRHKAMVFGIPEIGKEWFLKDKQLGKEEANEEIKQGMRELLLGLGAKRKQYPDTPCILVYHGAVAGASLSASQILPAGGIQIGRDDLALVGADFTILGHIHESQDIGSRAAYTGSAYPVDWAETTQRSFLYIEIDGAGIQPRVERIPYPHARRKKITINCDDGWSDDDVTGFQTWLNIRVTKEQAASIKADDLTGEIISRGALPGSRVTTEIIPTETVRAGEIQDAVKLRDKVQIYTANSQEKTADSILEKADSLELEARAEGVVTEGLHIRIKKLVLRGAIGILKGAGRDQVEIDLGSYDQGLVALVGVNGSGKTTLIENMHPYPQMLTRSGKLQDHFCLRDSFRDLTFTDERTGDEYRAFIQIDGVNKSGGVEYFLYKNGEPVTNGRKDDYEEKILKLFGSLPLYLRSAFVSQRQPKNLPDLSDATKGEKKALFRELGGLDYLQLYSESAKAKAQAIVGELIGIRAKTEREGDLRFTLKTEMEEIGEKSIRAGQTKDELEIVKARGFELKAKADTIAVRVAKNVELRASMESIKNQIAENEREGWDLAAKVQQYQLALAKKDSMERGLAEYDTLKEQEAKLNDERARLQDNNAVLLAQYDNHKDAVANTERALQEERRKITSRFSALEKDEAIRIQSASALERELETPVSDACPTCRQPWPPAERERFEDDRRKKAERLEIFKTEILELGQDIAESKKHLAKIEEALKVLPWPKMPVLPTFDEKALSEVRLKIAKLDISTLRDNQKKLAEAAVYIDEGKRRMMTLDEQHIEKEAEYSDCMVKIDKTAELEHQDAQKDLENTRRDYVRLESELAGIVATIAQMQKEQTRILGELEEIARLKTQGVGLERNRVEWEYLHRACGPDGIQALELDAMGPGIADVANRILESAYGSRFRIEFKTTRIGGSGSKTRQIEDFQIVIHDSTDGSEQLLETLSGGEGVWIKRAIYDAFGIIRDRKTGQRFLTCFMDEADGALDPEARVNYVRMIERAHQEAGRSHTIIITHSTEVQEMIGQKIEMKKIAEVVPVL